MINGLPLYLLVVVPSFLGSLPLHCVLLVLSLEVTLKLSELGLDLVFSVFANHFNGSQAFLGFAQLVLLLLGGTA